MLNTVEDARLVLVDSKRVEFNQYKNSELLRRNEESSIYKELTTELLTKQIVDAFIAKVIIINRKEIVICLNGNNQFDAKYIKENRKAIVKQKSILDGEVDLPRPFRPEHLHYKVVLL